MREKTVICEICQKEFSSSNKNIKYCSLECREKGERIKRAAWNIEHRSYYPEYMREYRAKIKRDKRIEVG